MDLFSFHNVKYKDVLDVPELTLPAERLICLVGPSGGGKTTLLRLLNNLISVDSGEILYKNKPMDEVDPIKLRRKVVLLPQTPAIFPGTIKDNLLAGLIFSGRTRPTDDVLESALADLHLTQGLWEGTASLSGGEKQRLALGRTLLMEPEALLLDEPTSALDRETERLIVDKLTAYRRGRAKTVVAATHSEALAAQADLILTIEEGRVRKTGSER